MGTSLPVFGQCNPENASRWTLLPWHEQVQHLTLGVSRRALGAVGCTSCRSDEAHQRPHLSPCLRHAPAARGTDIRTMQHLLGHNDLATTMISTHILQQGGQGIQSPLDDLGV